MTISLDGSALLGECASCGADLFLLLVRSRSFHAFPGDGDTDGDEIKTLCPHCRSAKVTWRWGKAKGAFTLDPNIRVVPTPKE